MLSARLCCRARRLWTTDGFRLYDPHDIWPLVDQDTCIVACDKNSFPGDITKLKRAMDGGGAAADGGGAEPRKKVKREPTDYHRCECNYTRPAWLPLVPAPPRC